MNDNDQCKAAEDMNDTMTTEEPTLEEPTLKEAMMHFFAPIMRKGFPDLAETEIESRIDDLVRRQHDVKDPRDV